MKHEIGTIEDKRIGWSANPSNLASVRTECEDRQGTLFGKSTPQLLDSGRHNDQGCEMKGLTQTKCRRYGQGVIPGYQVDVGGGGEVRVC